MKAIQWAISTGLVVFASIFAFACDPASMELIQTMSHDLVTSATTAAERASLAGQGEAALLEEFLYLTQTRLETAENSLGEIRNMAKQVTKMTAHVQAMIETIIQGTKEDPALEALVPLASTVGKMLGESLSTIQRAVQEAVQAVEEMRTLVQSIVTRMTWAVYPPPFSRARVEATRAQEALGKVKESAAAATRAVEAQRLEEAMQALLEALTAGTECLDAAWAAEYNFSALRDAVLEWERELYQNHEVVITAHGKAKAALEKVHTALVLLSELFSAGVVPASSLRSSPHREDLWRGRYKKTPEVIAEMTAPGVARWSLPQGGRSATRYWIL